MTVAKSEVVLPIFLDKEPVMERVTLGNSGVEVSDICLGTMYFGVKVAEDLSHRFMDIYYERGGRFFDTANKYCTWVPRFEEPVGEGMINRWLKSRKHTDTFIATKLGFPYKDVPMSLNPEIIKQEVDKSLERLGVDCIDLLYGHVDDYETPQEEYMQAFDSVVKAGKVREIGLSNVTAWRVAKANSIAKVNGWKELSCVQTRLSILWPRIDADFARQVPASAELLDLSREEGITLLCYSPFLQGCFGRDDRPIPDGYNTGYNRNCMAIISSIADKYEVSGNTIVASWMIEQGFIPLVTGSTEEQIIQNCEARAGLMAEDDVELLSKRFYPTWIRR